MIQFSALPNQPGISPVGEAPVKSAAENSDSIDFASLLNGQAAVGDAGAQADAAATPPSTPDLAAALAAEPAKLAIAALPPTGKILPLGLPGLPEAAADAEPAQAETATAATAIPHALPMLAKVTATRAARGTDAKAEPADEAGEAEAQLAEEADATPEAAPAETVVPTLAVASPILPQIAAPAIRQEQSAPTTAPQALPAAAQVNLPSSGKPPVSSGDVPPANSTAAQTEGKPVIAQEMPTATKALSLEQVRFVAPDAARPVEQAQSAPQPVAIATNAMLANAPQNGAAIAASSRSVARETKATAAEKFKDIVTISAASARDGAEISPLFGTAAPAAAAPATASTTNPATTNTDAANRPQDFATLVDRLIAVRQATNPQNVTVAVAHADFGKVELNFRQEDNGLSVALSSPDPDFSRAVSAALPQQAAIRTGDTANANSNSSSTAQQQSARQDSTAGSGADASANSRSGTSARRQDDNSPRANPSYRQGNSDGSDGRHGIFA